MSGIFGSASINIISQIADALKSGDDATLITGTAGSDGNLAQFNADGDLVDSLVAPASKLNDPGTTRNDQGALAIGTWRTPTAASRPNFVHVSISIDLQWDSSGDSMHYRLVSRKASDMTDTHTLDGLHIDANTALLGNISYDFKDHGLSGIVPAGYEYQIEEVIAGDAASINSSVEWPL